MENSVSMTNRTTSAGYRFPIAPRPKSAYHTTCVPAEKKQSVVAAAQPAKNYTQQDFAKCDSVTQDKIWKQMVGNEKTCIRKWDENWGFLKDYDQKGELKEKEELPEKVSVFSDNVPNTSNHMWGSRLTTETARNMLSMEHRFMSHNRHKSSRDLLCYD